ncbi:MAG: hypothetical protein HFJ38_07705 [Bacilli bacterium]|nr:hypothetical protein [Bacilli bacterium]
MNREDYKFEIENISSTPIDTMNHEENNEVAKEMYIKVNNRILTATLENNSSVNALIEKLEQDDITIDMKDYANFEKVGELGFSLPRNDKQIATEVGDIILYQGNSITIYYDTNSWNFTKLGKINNITQKELKDILGSGDATVTLSLNK